MQNVAVFDELTVRENIDCFCSLYITDAKTRKRCVDDAIAFVGLEDFTGFYPKKLSGGLLRRLNIACGIAHKPRLIILDEPTVAVDPQSRNKILEGIVELNRAGATVIYTSHYMEEVEQICTRIAIMDKGKNIALGTKEELIKEFTKHCQDVTRDDIDKDDKTDDYSENFHMLAEDWLSKKEGEITSKRIDDRYGVVNKILLKFKADELFLEDEGGRIRPTKKAKDLMPYVLRKDRVQTINSWIEEENHASDK
jgi:ABC-type multidrug transport system ATPase subunit